MKMHSIHFFLLLLAFGLAPQPLSAKIKQNRTERKTATQTNTVWVMKPSGTLSCDPTSGEPLERGKSELEHAKIKVLEYKRTMDGLLHIQMCGSSEGSRNAYLIEKEHQEKAFSLGYQLLK